MRVDFHDFCGDAGAYCLHAWEVGFVVVEFSYGEGLIVQRFTGDDPQEVMVPDVDPDAIFERRTNLVLTQAER